MLIKSLITVFVFLMLLGSAASNDAVRPGYLEGHMKIVSPKTVDLADGHLSTVTAEIYAEHPLIILSRDKKKEIARVTADNPSRLSRIRPSGLI